MTIILTGERAAQYVWEHLAQLYGIGPEVKCEWRTAPGQGSYGCVVITGAGGSSADMIYGDLHEASRLHIGAFMSKERASADDPAFIYHHEYHEPIMAMCIDLDRTNAIMNGEAA